MTLIQHSELNIARKIDSVSQFIIEDLRRALKGASRISGVIQHMPLRIEEGGHFIILGCGMPSVVLTPREREVLNLIGLDLGNCGIAHRLRISEATVHYHISRLLAKFNVLGRTALIRRAMSCGAIGIAAFPRKS